MRCYFNSCFVILANKSYIQCNEVFFLTSNFSLYFYIPHPETLRIIVYCDNARKMQHSDFVINNFLKKKWLKLLLMLKRMISRALLMDSMQLFGCGEATEFSGNDMNWASAVPSSEFSM